VGVMIRDYRLLFEVIRTEFPLYFE
jgi:hypothetical protein